MTLDICPGKRHGEPDAAPADPEQRDPADILFTCSLEDLNCLHDYMVAAIAGEDLSELPRLWNQQIGVIRSRQHPYPPKMASEKDLLNQIRDLHAAAHTEMCKDDADEIHVSFYKGQWLAYNNVAGLVEHIGQDTPAQQRIADAIKLIGEAKAANNNHHWLTVNKLLEQTIALLREVK